MRTFASVNAVLEADTIIGYKTYIRLIKDLVVNKTVITSGMKDEIERVTNAINYARSGNKVALVSSGDPGVYGMAGLAFEICKNKMVNLSIEIVPGVTAANSAAALLGAPLSCDYCVVSLSDLLVPADQIVKRIKGAALADFVTVLYNPAASARRKLIVEARDIFLEYRSPQTPVGVVRNIGRHGESFCITKLETFNEEIVDMVTTVIIGNSQTEKWKGRMINPRGYNL